MNKRVLVADDGAAMRALIRVSPSEPADIEEAADGREALTKPKETRFDSALLDCRMPRPDGPTILHIARKSGPAAPMIMVTAPAQRSHVMEAIRAGAAEYSLKPFYDDDLDREVCRLCPPHDCRLLLNVFDFRRQTKGFLSVETVLPGLTQCETSWRGYVA